MTCKEEKPKEIPYFLRSRGITPSPESDWVCEYGCWVWHMTPQESDEWNEKDPIFQDRFIPVSNPQGIHDVGKDGWVHVYKDGLRYYYVKNGVKLNLSTSWVIKNILTPKLPDLPSSSDIDRAIFYDEEDEKWRGEDILPDLKFPEIKLPDWKFPEWKLPKIDLGITKYIFLFILIIAGLIALGYSGVGKIAEREHEKRR